MYDLVEYSRGADQIDLLAFRILYAFISMNKRYSFLSVFLANIKVRASIMEEWYDPPIMKEWGVV